MARGEAPQTIDGKSLLPLLKNPDEAWPDRNLFFHVGRWSDAAGPDQSKYAATAGFAVRNTRYRLVNHEELYDILNDSGETKNLYSEKPEVVDNMQVHESMVNHVELAPTRLDFVGPPIPDDMQGYSLKPILEGRAEKVRDAAYYHFYSHGNNNPARNDRGAFSRAARNDRGALSRAALDGRGARSRWSVTRGTLL